MAASECMHDGLPLLKGGIFRESAFLQKHCGAVKGKAYAFRRVCIGADGDKATSEIMIFLQNGFSGIGFGKAFFQRRGVKLQRLFTKNQLTEDRIDDVCIFLLEKRRAALRRRAVR